MRAPATFLVLFAGLIAPGLRCWRLAQGTTEASRRWGSGLRPQGRPENSP